VVTCDELIALRCAPSRVGDYIACWWSGLNKLTSAGHPFDHADLLHHFVNHLPYGLTYDIIRESVLLGLSTTHLPEQLPPFESVVERVTNVDLNRTYFQPPGSRHPNNDIPSATTTPTSKDNLATLSTGTTTTNSSTQPRPPRSSNYGGAQGSVITDRNKPLARTYMADVNVDMVNDGGEVTSDQCSPSPSPPDDGAPLSITVFGTTSFVPSTVTPVNSNIYFDVYRAGVIPTALSSVTELSPVCLSTISQIFNSVLDSGCTNHIIRDRSLFWTYHTSLAIPVQTANCGVLETLAKGDIKF